MNERHHHGPDEERIVWIGFGTARHIARWVQGPDPHWGLGWRPLCGQTGNGLTDVPDPDEGASCRRCLRHKTPARASAPAGPPPEGNTA